MSSLNLPRAIIESADENEIDAIAAELYAATLEILERKKSPIDMAVYQGLQRVLARTQQFDPQAQANLRPALSAIADRLLEAYGIVNNPQARKRCFPELSEDLV